MSRTAGVAQAVDAAWEAAEKGHRGHLGASLVGKPCERAMVYSFRHATKKRTAGRMLRLFNRGHREEIAIISWLRMVGFEVREFAERLVVHRATDTYEALPWDAPLSPDKHLDVSAHTCHVECAALAGVQLKQWSFKDVGGHHAGSGDGMAMNPGTNPRQFPKIPPDTWFNLEFKTYNTKGFGYMTEADDLVDVKPEHCVQVQEYMHYLKLPFTLYLGINKNDDTLHDEVLPYSEPAALAAIEKARRGISARQLPPRISNNATNFTCKFCDHKATCHFGAPMEKSCRSCAHVVAVTEGDAAIWHCAKWTANIPKEAVPHGCDQWVQLTD